MDETDDETLSIVEVSSSSASQVEDTAMAFHNLHPKECMEKLENGWSPWVLDVRLPTEHDIVALPFTDRVAPHRTVKVTDIPTTGDVLVYCKAGIRGKKACVKLIEQGVPASRLYNLDGGIMKWRTDIDTSMPHY
jgi:sulfur-carrier protein adenylyltransferase/sulfurtransferase